MRPASALALAALVAALCGCRGSAPRPWGRPAAPHPRSLLPTSGDGTAFSTDEPTAAFWRSLGDQRLVALLDEVARSNPDLHAAAARVRAVRAIARRAASERLPRLDASAGATFQRAGTAAGGDRESFDATLDPSWEIDLFGRLARARDAAAFDALATEEDRRALVLALQAEAAVAWFDWGAARGEEEVFLETDRLLGKTQEVVKARIDAEIGDELALRRVESELFASRAEVPGARLRAAQARHRLALLLGRPPDASLEPPPAALPVPPTLPVGLPATLLRRRPDVRAAERRIDAAHARVAQAWADFLPTVTIGGNVGVSSLDLSDLFTGRALLALVSPRFTVPLLDGGRLEAARLEREARRDEAAAQWVAVALRAFSEVADAVEGTSLRRQALELRRQVVAAARQALDLANARFPQQVGYLDVVDSHEALQNARLLEVREARDLRRELVRLARALGGGWGDCPP